MDFWLFLFSKDTEFEHPLVTVTGSSSTARLGNQNFLSLLQLLNSCSRTQIFMMSEKVISASQLNEAFTIWIREIPVCHYYCISCPCRFGIDDLWLIHGFRKWGNFSLVHNSPTHPLVVVLALSCNSFWKISASRGTDMTVQKIRCNIHVVTNFFSQ